MATAFLAVGVVLILYVGYRLCKHLFPPPNISPNGKYILISSCDSGIGHALAIDLDKQGFNVLAGVYDPDNEERVASQLSSRATVFCLDVTRQEEIDAAYNMVTEKTNTLHALINNAGISANGLIDWVSVETMQKLMDVNFFGHVKMTKTFLPLLISRRHSRIVNICSVAGYLVKPGAAAYAASKFALEAFSDCLRREMHSWGLHVCIVEPGFMRTPIIEGRDRVCREEWSKLDSQTRDRWGEEFFHDFIHGLERSPFVINAENPQKVVQAIRHSVMNSVPRIRYRPGWQSSLFLFPISMLPAWLTDLIMIKMHTEHVSPAGLLHQHN
ncbi:unnamed protein product [Rotaria socialis]|uniref:Uncharacterized protein n=1 Tax=Rotaria socialis TaxID=392032 RepID=A0A817U7Q5_9BILA|nr:unnamed protein product [Rotaria socialis]CAF3328263.1 unnamed protein product [Rotaria socialis]CAF3436970.1 unnamed protein product [Rotaria socialis]CAF4253816.1 unnamed protein product [Rotaria socialis]CAF4358035.1 unnamed protein product [Rotaria socialis]